MLKRINFAILWCLFIACYFSSAHGHDGEVLKVGMELSYPPFEMVDAEGKPSGISVDIAYALGDYLKRPVEIVNIPFIGLIPSLKTGKVDILISSLSVTKARERSIDFSRPYLETGLCLLLNINSTIKSIEDANRPSQTIVVKQGTTGEVYARAHLPKARVIVLDKEASCVLEVVQGKADAFIYDQFSIFTHWQKNQSTTKALLDPFLKEYWAIGLRKGDTAFKDQLNAFLGEFRHSQGFERLTDKYLSSEKAIFAKLGIQIFL